MKEYATLRTGYNGLEGSDGTVDYSIPWEERKETGLNYSRGRPLHQLLSEGWHVISTAISTGYEGHRYIEYHFILERER